MLKCTLKEKVIVGLKNIIGGLREEYDLKVDAWKENTLHWAFAKETQEMADAESRSCLRNVFLKKETERKIYVAQEQALQTNCITGYIEGKRDRKTAHSLANELVHMIGRTAIRKDSKKTHFTKR